MENYYPDLAKLSAKNNAKLLHERVVSTMQSDINSLIDNWNFKEAWIIQKVLDNIMRDYNQEVHWVTKQFKTFKFKR